MKKISCIAMSAVMLSSLAFVGCGGGDSGVKSITADEYKISIACQVEESEQAVMEELIDAYEAKNPKHKVELRTFSGKAFGEFMSDVSSDRASSPNIIWTSDALHMDWNEFFIDLRPFYERTDENGNIETDYSLYYSSMLDTAALNGKFKPTKNYTGTYTDDLDTSDGLNQSNHSEYGLYFAPRDYNKPTILCNMALFANLDEDYEKTYKRVNSVDAMPTEYLSTTARLNEIVAGGNWNELSDLFDFAKFTAEKVEYLLSNASNSIKDTWRYMSVLDLKLNWEPSYTTILKGLGVENIINPQDGKLALTNVQETLQKLHDDLYAEDNLYYADANDLEFKQGNNMMRVVSRPVLLGYNNELSDIFSDYVDETGNSPLQAIRIPAENIAAGCSGYAINRVWYGKSVTVDGVEKTYEDLSWDFIKFIISKEGQEIAGATGHNVPILKSLRDAESNGGITPAWRNVEGFAHMDHNAWIAGEELQQDWFNIYKPTKRVQFKDTIDSFFKSFVRSNYGEGSLSKLITETNKRYNAVGPTDNLR